MNDTHVRENRQNSRIPAEKILLIEDEVLIALNEAELLERHGFTVVIAHTGDSAVQLVRDDPDIKLILLDVNLGDGSSTVDVAGRIDSIRELPVIILTGYTNRQVIDTIGEITRYGYILKGSGEYVLIESVRKALELFEVHRATKSSEKLYRTILSNISDAVFLTDEDDNFQFVCPNFNVIFGYAVEEIFSFGSISKLFGDTVVGGADLDVKGEVTNIEREVTDKYGKKHIVLVNVKRVSIGGGTRLYTCRDISSLRQKEAALRESEKQYKNLAAHLQLLLEEHDQHISRELHDGLGQDLALLRMNLQRIAKENSSAAPSVAPLVNRVSGIIESVRTIISDLRPFPLDEFGLQSAIEERLEEFREATGIGYEIRGLPVRIHAPPQVLQGVYKIFQEALVNVMKHASATEISICLTLVDGWLLFEMADNGRGFEGEETETAGTFGLLGMFERTELLGGRLTICGNRGEGMELVLKIPLNKSLQVAVP